MNKRSCYLCGSQKQIFRNGLVRDNPKLKILECSNCGLVFLSSFSHINDKFYENSGMHGGKVNLKSWLQETAMDDIRRFNFLQELIENKSVLDFGCGNGRFLVKAKKVAKYVEGIEKEQVLNKYFKNKGLKVFSNINEITKSFDVITLFHVLEHISDPRNTLLELKKKIKPKGQLIVEVPNSNDALLTLYKSMPFARFTYWSCHLYLFNNFTLSKLAKQVGLKINYIKQVQRYPLSNHLYWLSAGKPGGHKKWGFLDSEELSFFYEKQLADINACDTIIASFGLK